MKTRAALVLSVAGILVTGSAALAVNTQVLSTAPSGTGNANSVLLPSKSSSTAAPTAAVVAKATPNVTSVVDGGSTVPAPAKTKGAPESGDSKGGRRTAPSPSPSPSSESEPEPEPEPGDDRDHEDGTVTGMPDAGPAASQPGGTIGSPSGGAGAAGDPAVVAGQTGDDKGGLRTAPEPGDDKSGQRKDSGSGEDSGGHGLDD
ncbi:hypothetical protein [Arthrobacter globiformis]|uniref:Uncharacterized protein n=1 Tax=Arthrobacter globiformis TaxID=1665 RepID=A0A328HBH6_ARTGO|nr:hypothetical protein [Arthrobacter globiformis]RAM35878.1 hypothetical protein DBZ45_17075 [Arthrobacter globiformis]